MRCVGETEKQHAGEERLCAAEICLGPCVIVVVEYIGSGVCPYCACCNDSSS